MVPPKGTPAYVDARAAGSIPKLHPRRPDLHHFRPADGRNGPPTRPRPAAAELADTRSDRNELPLLAGAAVGHLLDHRRTGRGAGDARDVTAVAVHKGDEAAARRLHRPQLSVGAVVR